MNMVNDTIWIQPKSKGNTSVDLWHMINVKRVHVNHKKCPILHKRMQLRKPDKTVTQSKFVLGLPIYHISILPESRNNFHAHNSFAVERWSGNTPMGTDYAPSIICWAKQIVIAPWSWIKLDWTWLWMVVWLSNSFILFPILSWNMPCNVIQIEC